MLAQPGAAQPQDMAFTFSRGMNEEYVDAKDVGYNRFKINKMTEVDAGRLSQFFTAMAHSGMA